jgi:chromosome segregation ATPase
LQQTSELEQKLSEKDEALASLESNYAFCRMELNSARNKLTQLTATLAEKDEEKVVIETDIAAKEIQVNQLKNKIAEITEALGEKTSEVEELSTKLIEAARYVKLYLNLILLSYICMVFFYRVHKEELIDAETELSKCRAEFNEARRLYEKREVELDQVRQELAEIRSVEEKTRDKVYFVISNLMKLTTPISYTPLIYPTFLLIFPIDGIMII